MRNFTLGTALATTLTMALTVAVADTPAPPRPGPVAQVDATYADITRTLGLVPTFMKAFPEVGIAAAWDGFKALELNPNTALDGQTKELIGLAVAAQIPCKYCVYFHTQAARVAGALNDAIKEAIAMAAITREWSTVLNGMQIDETAFRKEVTRALAYVKAGKAPAGPELAVTDAASAYKDIERTMGAVPTFLKSFPAEAIGPAWREMKSVQMNPSTQLSGKTKELIGLAVAAQVPCKYCVYFHTETAKLNGATPREVSEAVAMAAHTRHWSTVLNGSQIDETQFKREVDQVMSEAKKQMTMRDRPPR